MIYDPKKKKKKKKKFPNIKILDLPGNLFRLHTRLQK